MENAAEALKMAGSILLFVLALSVVIPLFSRARTTAESVMEYSDRESKYLNVDELGEDFYFYVGNGDKKVRDVSLETIIPTIYRSYKENSKVVFTIKNAANAEPEKVELYSYRKSGIWTKFNSIDLKYTSIATGREKEFIDGIVYADFTNSGNSADEFEKKFAVRLDGEVNTGHGLYDYLKDKIESGKPIIEHLGVYYQEDVTNDRPDSVPEANKDEKRVVTYEIQNY